MQPVFANPCELRGGIRVTPAQHSFVGSQTPGPWKEARPRALTQAKHFVSFRVRDFSPSTRTTPAGETRPGSRSSGAAASLLLLQLLPARAVLHGDAERRELVAQLVRRLSSPSPSPWVAASGDFEDFGRPILAGRRLPEESEDAAQPVERLRHFGHPSAPAPSSSARLTARARSNRCPSAAALLKSSSIASWNSRSASATACPSSPPGPGRRARSRRSRAPAGCAGAGGDPGLPSGAR